jgi:hypothetical protein
MLRYTLPLATLLAFLPARTSAQPPPGASRDRIDEAVERALAFLKTQQDSDGAWRAHNQKNPAITALAVMAYLSAGHVPGEGPYADTVERGIRWVLKQQKPNGLIASVGGHEMYHHGICSLMLAEVAGMTQGQLALEVKTKLEKAVAVILKAQRTAGHFAGGWRYQVGSPDADMSVTGWQLLALRAAKNLGCDVPAARIDLAVSYVKRSRDPRSGGFGYTPGGGYTIPCTGTGILALEICGKDRHHSPEALKAGAFLIKNPPAWNSGHFFYAVYYCSQATFQLGNNYWNYYRPQLHKVLLDHQQPGGAWIGSDGYGAAYGTAMSVLALTVEYRFLPIYQRGEEPNADGK